PPAPIGPATSWGTPQLPHGARRGPAPGTGMLAEFSSRPVPFVAVPHLEGADDLIQLTGSPVESVAGQRLPAQCSGGRREHDGCSEVGGSVAWAREATGDETRHRDGLVDRGEAPSAMLLPRPAP